MISVFGSRAGEAELAQLAESIRAQWLGFGPKVAEFERRLAARLGLDDLVMVDSGSNALYMAVHLLDLAPGSEVILPSFTWVSCAHAVVLAGHRPVFCDVDPATANVTAQTIRPHLGERTGAIMVVHYAGKPVDMGPIVDLGYPVIEDAAHAVDSRLDGVACGGIGDVGIWSFDAVKNLAAGEGGGLTARDPERIARARRLRYCGIGKSGFESSRASAARWWEHEISEVFVKMLPSDLGAGVALAQLEALDANQARRREIWARYDRELAGLDWLETPPGPVAGRERHSWFTYLVRVRERDALARHLLEREIYTTLRYHPLHLSPIYASHATLPGCDALNRTGLNIPLHPRLSDADVDRVVEAIVEFGRGAFG